MSPASPEALKETVIELIAECRRRLTSGWADVTEVERGVRAYCEVLTALPAEEGRHHIKDLEAMMQAVTLLGDELVAARDTVRHELGALGRVRQANVAYQKSDAIGEKYEKKESESE